MNELTIEVVVSPVQHPGGVGWADLNILTETVGPYTVEWKKINADGTREVIFTQYYLLRNVAIGEYEVTVTDSSDPVHQVTFPFTMYLHENIGFNVTTGQVTAYGKADGSIVGRITGGTAPYRAEVSVNGNPYRTITDIPAAVSAEDNNCNIQGLPPGAYTIWVYDSETPEQRCGGSVNYTIISPPFATMNGDVNPLGVPTTVIFEWGKTVEFGNVAEFGMMNQSGLTPVARQLDCLAPETTYFYRIKAVNASGIPKYSEVMTFTTSPVAPIVIARPATNIG